MLKILLFALLLAGTTAPAVYAASPADDAATQTFRFISIDGGEIGFSDWPGQPVLVANTASLCAFSGQYADLQDLYDTYRARGLIVLAVPSDDFRQELATDAAVKEYCALTFGLDLPMSGITPVTGSDAHPFYLWLKATTGFQPGWNFNKVLIGADGTVLGTWGSLESPTGATITTAVEGALGL